MCSRENSDVASLSFDYFWPGQMFTWPRWVLQENRRGTKWLFWVFVKLPKKNVSCSAAQKSGLMMLTINDVLLSGTILIHRVASSTQTFHQAKKAVDNKPCPVLIWSSSSWEKESHSRALKWQKKNNRSASWAAQTIAKRIWGSQTGKEENCSVSGIRDNIRWREPRQRCCSFR